MEVARSPMAIPSQTQAAEVAPPGARDAADGFSQVSTRDLAVRDDFEVGAVFVDKRPRGEAVVVVFRGVCARRAEVGRALPRRPEDTFLGREASAATAAATAAEPPAFGAARREARVVREGAAGDEEELVHFSRGLGSERRAPRASGKWLSQLVKSSVFAQNLSSLQAGEAKRPPTPKVVNQRALARNSQLALYASRGRAMSVDTYTSIRITHNTNYPQQNTPSGTREHLSGEETTGAARSADANRPPAHVSAAAPWQPSPTNPWSDATNEANASKSSAESHPSNTRPPSTSKEYSYHETSGSAECRSYMCSGCKLKCQADSGRHRDQRPSVA